MEMQDIVGFPDGAGAGADRVDAAFRDHWVMLRRSAIRAIHDPDAAADVVQDAFLRLLSEAAAGRFPDSVSAWLYRTSTNLIISRARRAAVARRSESALLRRDQPGEPQSIASMRERGAAVGLALTRVSSVERTVLLMAAEGATGDEMTAKLGRTAGATRTLLCRARRHLRFTLDEIESGSLERARVAGASDRHDLAS